MYLSEATPGGRDSGAPFWNHANVIERGEHGVPGVTPSRFVILGELDKGRRGIPALLLSLSEARDGGRDSGAPFWTHEKVIERGKHGVPGVTPSRFVILGGFM